MKKYTLDWWKSLPPEKTGKETEKLVEALFVKWNDRSQFSHQRLPDAKSARGFLAAQPADYIWWSLPHGGYLEVKACNHPYRIAKDKIRQLALLRKHALAGARSLILVNHYLLGKWRIIHAAQLEVDQPSWNLSEHPLCDTAEDALKSTGLFGG